MYNSMFNNLWSILDQIDTMPSTKTSYSTKGLKSYVNRPHNLRTETDDAGNVTKYSLDFVYTPWKAADIHCKYSSTDDGTKLTITVGDKDKSEHPDELYRGISRQAFTVTLPLVGVKVDPSTIKIIAEDGICSVEIPVDRSSDQVVDIPVNH